MITLTMNRLPVMVDEGSTLLDAARFLGIEIPTLCHMDGLTPYGACRLCVVEIGDASEVEVSVRLHLPGRRRVESTDRFVARHAGAPDGAGTSAGFGPAIEGDSGPSLGVRRPPAALPAGARRTASCAAYVCACVPNK